jgi:hypothetical protein
MRVHVLVFDPPHQRVINSNTRGIEIAVELGLESFVFEVRKLITRGVVVAIKRALEDRDFE